MVHYFLILLAQEENKNLKKEIPTISEKFLNLNQFHEFDSDLTKKLKNKLNQITSAKNSIININSQVSEGFVKMKTILESRCELSQALRDFNDSSKNIISQKEK